jgi:hypothetical protein
MSHSGSLRRLRLRRFTCAGACGLPFLFLVLSIASAFASSADDRPGLAFQATADSRVTIAGRASVGRWECDTTEISAAIEPGARLVSFFRSTNSTALAPDGAAASKNPSARISIPVESLRCAKLGMRADLLRALRHDKAPLIIFQLSAVEQIERRPSTDGWAAYAVTAAGDLQLAGEVRPIRVVAEVHQESATRFRVIAKQTLQMSDFSIDPPTAFFGLIRTENTVEIAFDLGFELSLRD